MKHAIMLLVTFAGLGAAALIVSGCQGHPQQPPFEQAFFANENVQSETAVVDAQLARGARADGTLYPRHFDGPQLTVIGQGKLDLMLKDNSQPLPLLVFLDLPETDGRADVRAEAVRTHLADAGLRASQFKIERGANPATLHAAAPALSRLAKTENPPAQENAPASSSPNAPAAASAPLDLSSLGLPPKK